MAFELHYLKSSKNEKWKSQIDHNVANKNWYIMNKNKYGKPKYAITRWMMYWFVSSLIISIFYLAFPKHHSLFIVARSINFTLGSVPLLILIYIYSKCPKHIESNDNFLFHYEFKATISIYLAIGVVYVVISICNLLKLELIEFSGCFIWFMTVFPSLLSTLWIPKKILSTETWGKQNRYKAMIEIDETKSRTQRFKEILLNEEKFESFIHWMYREFSSEVILCFIEFVQFKHYLSKLIEEESQEQIECTFRFYENIPKSSIIFNEKNKRNRNKLGNIEYDDIASETKNGSFQIKVEDRFDAEHKYIAHKLYLKYIQTYAENEINISTV